MEQIQKLVASAASKVADSSVDAVLTRPDPKFGDFACNVAMSLAKKLGQNPHQVAESIAAELRNYPEITEASVAGPGFINIRVSNAVLLEQLSVADQVPQSLEGKTVVAEYSDPNPFKILHAGHLYTSVVGDAIANLLEVAGADVHRVNFGGDVGLHVGKTMWAILESLSGENIEGLNAYSSTDERTAWLAECYIKGTAAYEDDESAKKQIIELNKRVYQLHATNDRSSDFAQIYWTTRQWSYEYFDAFYERIGTRFEKYYPESSVAELGLNTVREQTAKGVFEESDDAVVFRGEAHGLHTRVFINKEGLPTYEAKDVGLIFTKMQDYNFDLSVVITGNEQEQYMAVVLKAIEQFAPKLSDATRHLTHGIVKLKHGVKMSSRKGNILRAVDVLEAAKLAHVQLKGSSDDNVELGAVKYAFLKVRTGGDIIYDPDESMSMEGNSGPYLQYAHARASSIFRKASARSTEIHDLSDGERTLVVKICEFKDVIEKAVSELSPHIVCTYLYELTQEFNRFYEKNRIIGDEREGQRLAILERYKTVLSRGLSILGIPAPEKM